MNAKLLMLTALVVFFFTVPVSANPGAGEGIFNGDGKCKTCHNITDKKKVGPGLAGILTRAPEAWVAAFLKDPAGVWKADEGYTKTLKNATKAASKPSPSHKTPPLTDQQITDLTAYLKTL